MSVETFIEKMERGLPAACMEQEVGANWLQTIKDAAKSDDQVALCETLQQHRSKQASADPESLTFKVNKLMSVFYEMCLKQLLKAHLEAVCLIMMTLPTPA